MTESSLMSTRKQKTSYPEKFESIREQTRYDRLDLTMREALRGIAGDYRFTLQELRRSVDAALDLRMWGDTDFPELWLRWRRDSVLEGREFKKWAFSRLEEQLRLYRESISDYREVPPPGKPRTASRPILEARPANDQVFGMCPVM